VKNVLTERSLRFLASARVGHLSTADSQGKPYVVPVVFVVDEGIIYTPIDGKKKGDPRKLQRIRNILENPQVGFIVDRYEEDWTKLGFVFVRGKASLLIGQDNEGEKAAGEEYRRCILLLREKYPQYQSVSLGGPEGLMIRVTPESCTTWGQLEEEKSSESSATS
jgi:PPOX class probable F420-dependent enzyme